MTKLIAYARGNAIAIAALFLALSGGYAIAATTAAKTITACASKQTGELFLSTHGRCAKNERKVAWNQQGPQGIQGKTGLTGPSGQTPPSAWAIIGNNGNPAGSGVSSQLSSTGVFQVTFTPGACVGAFNAPVVTPFGENASMSGTKPLAWIAQTTQSNVFTVYTGTEPAAGGAFTPANLAFDVQDVCP
jgi:hypothetical protein